MNINLDLKEKYDLIEEAVLKSLKERKVEVTKDNIREIIEIRGLEVEGYEVELSGDIDDQNNLTFGYTSLDGVTSKGTKQPRELPNQMLSLWYSYQA